MKFKLLVLLTLLILIGCKSEVKKKESSIDQKEKVVEPIKVTVDNFVRAETDGQMLGYSNKGAFGKFYHITVPYPIENQTTIRGNRDTYYSTGVFDLTTPITIHKPESPNRFQSMLIINEDHSMKPVIHEGGDFVLTKEAIGTRYVFIIIRTFIDPTDPEDIKKGLLLQSQVTTSQKDLGKLELPNWDEKSRLKVRDSLNTIASAISELDEYFGDKDKLDYNKWLLGAAFGWGGNPKEGAIYRNVNPSKNDGTTPYMLNVKDVPVDGFWSVTVYNKEGFLEKNDLGIYSYNNITADKNDDGSFTINFGGNPEQINYMPITKGWNYIVRLYQPKEELLNGDWSFPAPTIKE